MAGIDKSRTKTPGATEDSPCAGTLNQSSLEIANYVANIPHAGSKWNINIKSNLVLAKLCDTPCLGVPSLHLRHLDLWDKMIDHLS
ncbi:hypothetical protein TNCV_2325861 [Trichonephila clavipes]|nr:hypothetical protein TNCV_2325861 [Trichonephila clavipes]